VFEDLHVAVKLLLGRLNWSTHCQALADELVEHIRGCLLKATGAAKVTFIIR
jgi:hypothetical protein